MKIEDLQLDPKDLSILTQVVYKQLNEGKELTGTPEENMANIVKETMSLVKCIAQVRTKHREAMEKLKYNSLSPEDKFKAELNQ